MHRVQLEERLLQAGASDNIRPKAFWLYLDDYFFSLSKMSHDLSYADFYTRAKEKGAWGDIENIFTSQMAAEAVFGTHPHNIASEMLYQMLIRPFCDRNIWETKGGKRK